MPVDVSDIVASFSPDNQNQRLDPLPGAPEEAGWLGHGSWLHTLGSALDRPGNAVRSTLNGDLENGVAGLPGMVGGAADAALFNLPHMLTGKTLQDRVDESVGYDPAKRVSGQDLLKSAGLLDRADNPLFGGVNYTNSALDNYVPNPAGAAGMGLEMLLDPLNLVGGGLTKAGLAAEAKGALGATKAAQAANGERALLKLGGRVQPLPFLPAMDLPEQTLIKGTGAYETAGKLYDKMPWARGPIEAASAKAERVRDVIQKDAQTEEQLTRKLYDAQQAGAPTTDIETELGKYQRKFDPALPANASPQQQLGRRLGLMESAEKKLGFNVGSELRQITPENMDVLRGFEQSGAAPQIVDAAEKARVAKGLPPLIPAGGTPQVINDLKGYLDHSELSVPEINDAIESVTGKRLLTEDVPTALRMRTYQHARAQMLGVFADEMEKAGLATPGTAALQQTGWALPGKGNIQQVKLTPVSSGFIVPDLVAGPNQPLVFHRLEDAKRAAALYQKLADPVESNPVLRFIDSINNASKGAVTSPFPQFHMQNHLSNRVQAWAIGDVPVVGSHYDIANQIMGGGGLGKTYNVGAAGPLTGEQIVNLYQRGGAGALHEINPVAGKLQGLGAAEPVNGILDKVGRGVKAGWQGLENIASAPAGIGMELRNPGIIGQVNGKMIEDADRLGVFINKLSQGYTPEAAAAAVDGALFNHATAALNPLERQLSRATLFYNFTRNVLPAMAQTLLEKPGKAMAMLRLGEQPGQPSSAPPYLQDQLIAGTGREGEAVSQIPNPLEAGLKPAGGETILAQLNPLGRFLVSNGTGVDLQTSQPLSKQAPNWMPDALVNQIQNPKTGVVERQTAIPGLSSIMSPETQNLLLQNTPVSRFSSTANAVMKPEAQGGDVAFNMLTSMKMNRYEPKVAQMRGGMSALENQLRSYAMSGYVYKTDHGYSINPIYFAKLPPDEQATVAQAVRLYSAYGTNAAKLRTADKLKPAP